MLHCPSLNSGVKLHKNILIIDDDQFIRDLLTAFLTQSGFAVHVAKDGFTGMDDVLTGVFDLVIVDISMPHMNGFGFLKSLRESKYSNLPAIMLTNSKESSDIARSAKLGVEEYLLKPPEKFDLLKRVERILGGLPQFEEIIFSSTDPDGVGHCTLPFKLVSISNSGMILNCPFSVGDDFVLDCINIDFLKKLKIENLKIKVVTCTKAKSGGYDCFLSFIGINRSHQEKLREWIISKSFEQRTRKTNGG